MNNKRRIIEVAFPVEEVSGSGAREIAGIHTWWARRPLGPTRATTYAALVDSSIRFKSTSTDNPINFPKRDFIVELAKWENATKPVWIEQAKRDILESNNGVPPKILDPFGGGGSIPLEAQRLGCDTYSSDLSPISVIIQKCTIEFPQKYRQRLYLNVEKWGKRIISEVQEELHRFYPCENDGSHLNAYIWTRTLPCQNISCNVIIPLLRQYWLANNKKKRISLLPYLEKGQISFRIVGDGYEPLPSSFDPSKGTVKRAIVTCPICKNTIPAKETHRLFQQDLVGEQLIVVVNQHSNYTGRHYRIATDTEMECFTLTKDLLIEKQNYLYNKWGVDPIPDEPTPEGTGAGAPVMVRNYNFNTYGELFNTRQQLVLVTFLEKIKDSYQDMISQGVKSDLAQAVTTYLGLWLNRIAEISSNLCRWENTAESAVRIYGMQALSIAWDYAEVNSLRNAADRLQNILRPLKHLTEMHTEPVKVSHSSATDLPYSDNTFDAVLTDPPYYNNIGYAYLSEFYYVWLKRSIGSLYPSLFKTDMTPKIDEVVAYPHLSGKIEASKKFEKGLSDSFSEIHRVLKPDGIAVIVYAHKSAAGWETLINALLDSGLVITGAWSIEAEPKSKYGSQGKATLVSTIYMVARKTKRKPFGLYKDIRAELEKYLKERYVELWASGVSGADLFIAAIGNALQVFGKYEEVMDYEGNPIRADRMLEDIRQFVSIYAAEQIGTEATSLTRFYLLWRQEHGTKRVPFDEAMRLALPFGIDLAQIWDDRNFISREGNSIRVLGPHERDMTDITNSDELIDVLHQSLLLWRLGQREEMIQILGKKIVGSNEHMWNVAQAISLALPLEAEERKWLEGWLADKESINQNVVSIREVANQSKLL